MNMLLQFTFCKGYKWLQSLGSNQINTLLQLTFCKGYKRLQSLGSNHVKYGVKTYFLWKLHAATILQFLSCQKQCFKLLSVWVVSGYNVKVLMSNIELQLTFCQSYNL